MDKEVLMQLGISLVLLIFGVLFMMHTIKYNKETHEERRKIETPRQILWEYRVFGTWKILYLMPYWVTKICFFIIAILCFFVGGVILKTVLGY